LLKHTFYLEGGGIPRNNNIKLLLLVIKYLGNVKGRTRLQKILYLLKEQFGFEIAYKFMPYYYGPYASELQNDIDILARLGLVDVTVNFLDDGRFYYEHRLTDQGKKIAEDFEKTLQEEQIRQLKKALAKLKRYDLEHLVQKAKETMKQKLGEDKVRLYLY